jgi:hypothetical protein
MRLVVRFMIFTSVRNILDTPSYVPLKLLFCGRCTVKIKALWYFEGIYQSTRCNILSSKYSECVFVDLGSMNVMRLRHIVTLTCPSLQYFSTLSHKRHDSFFKKRVLNIKCVFWFSVYFFLIFLIIHRTERDIVKSVDCSLCKVAVILVRFWWNLKCDDKTVEKYSHIKCHRNLSSESGVVPCGQTDGRTWRS